MYGISESGRSELKAAISISMNEILTLNNQTMYGISSELMKWKDRVHTTGKIVGDGWRNGSYTALAYIQYLSQVDPADPQRGRI